MQLDFSAFKQKIPIFIDSDDFIVKTAKNKDDINESQKLRHDIFLEEWQGKTHESGLDFDEYDVVADHLLIVEKKSNLLVGTCRFIHSQFSNKFYSQTEFMLDGFLKSKESKLEIGRVCTHKDFRNGRTMDLLWQGLAEYITQTKSRFLFGCSSMTISDPELMFSLAKSLHQDDKLKFEFNIQPVAQLAWPESQKCLEDAQTKDGYSRQLPTLLRSYIQAGSFIYGMPAFDKYFNWFVVFTILDLHHLNKKYIERYKPIIG